MREITSHKVNECNAAITLLALGEPGAGGANCQYAIEYAGGKCPSWKTRLFFQNGPVADGVNGITHEVLLAILIDRLESFQRGPFACEANGIALTHLRDAAGVLKLRTEQRLARGVEGTHQV